MLKHRAGDERVALAAAKRAGGMASVASGMMPLQACLGGLFIGTACGAYMILVGRIAGNSGVMKALLLGPREPAKIAFMCGLMGGGALMKTLLPGAFEVARAPSLAIALSGLAVGLGVALRLLTPAAR